MTDAEYRDMYKTHLNFSFLKAFIQNPIKALYDKEHQTTTEAMIFGSAFHSICLEDGKDVAILPEINKRTKAGKEEFKAFDEANKGKYIITPEQEKSCLEMKQSLLTGKLASFAKNMQVEQVFSSTINGVDCCCRADIVINQAFGSVIADIKTTNLADYDLYKWDIKKYKYIEQLAFYSLVADLAPDCYILAVEKKKPYFRKDYLISDDSMDQAVVTVLGWIDQYRIYMEEPDEYLANFNSINVI